MKIYINNFNGWLQGIDDPSELTSWAKGDLLLPDEFTPPKPQYYPKGQLRRLSPFSKVALHCLDIPNALTQNLPLIFASQHGDLAKTVKLIKDAARGEDLSPTQFALSVHNATTGLFSIATHNTAATTTISAGKNSFIEGLIEASMQSQQEKTSVIYSYCDFDVPTEYRQFEQHKPARCITMVLASEHNSDNIAEINITLSSQTHSTDIEQSDFSIDFIRNFHLQSNTSLTSNNYSLCLGFNNVTN